MAEIKKDEQTRQIFENIMKREKASKLERFRHLNPFMKKGQILFTGSSLMEHFPVEELCMSMDVDKIIYNRGIGGFTTDEFLANIDLMLLDPEASKVFINIGTNDINESFGANGAWLDRLITNYDAILSQLKAKQPECEVYIMAYYPANMDVIEETDASFFKTRTLENMQKANAAVKELAEKFGYNYIDVNDGLADEKGYLKREYTIEGVHMYPDAYVQVLKNLTPYL